MSFRSRYLVYVSGWAAVVAALVVGVPAVLRSRLPEHVAVDWDFTDHPQDSADLRDFVVSRLLCWLVVAAFWGWFGLRARTERRWVWTAVLLAATECTRFFPMLTTAAGTVKPASALVLGVGVAGLQALATAKRLGARTTGYDVRPEVADQVRSVGAQWLDLGLEAVGEGGYARELTAEEQAEQSRLLADAVTGFDVVITTALVPGRPAPRLVPADAVRGMRPGSVVVDLAGATGGNCELSEPGDTVVVHDVTVTAPLNLPASMPEHASELYARNVQALLELLVVDGRIAPDFSDEVLADCCVTRED